jgi:hypothetical protein
MKKIYFSQIIEFIIYILLICFFFVNIILWNGGDYSNYLSLIQDNQKIDNNFSLKYLFSFFIFKFLSLGGRKIHLDLFLTLEFCILNYLLYKISISYLSISSRLTRIAIISSNALSFSVLSLCQSIIKQGIAITFLLAFLISIDKKKSFIMNLSLYLLASISHISASVFFPILFCQKKIYFYICLFLIPILFILNNYLNYLEISEYYFTGCDLFNASKLNILCGFFILFCIVWFYQKSDNIIRYFFLVNFIVLLSASCLSTFDRFAYFSFILAPIIFFRFLRNESLIIMFSFFWILINIIYAPQRYLGFFS